MKKQLLLIDDDQFVLDSLRRMLRPERNTWEVNCCSDSVAAWQQIQAAPCDAAILDVNMPHLTGLQLLERIKNTESTRDIPVVMLTGQQDRALKRQALDLGAADLLNKPAQAEDLIARIRNTLRLKAYEDELRAQNAMLEQRVDERTVELNRSRLDAIWRLGKAAEQRDNETGNHVIRVGCMSRAVAKGLGMDRSFTETLFVAAPLHDIGKIGIPDVILLKRGSLSQAEWHVMKQHCWIGAKILEEDYSSALLFRKLVSDPELAKAADRGNPWLELAASIAMNHHERWDGTGYPQGLAGEDIPIEARIVAIADVFDALMSRRPYKPPLDEDEALGIIRDSVGSQFDPQVHAAFERVLSELQDIRKQLYDRPGNGDSEEACNAPSLVCR